MFSTLSHQLYRGAIALAALAAGGLLTPSAIAQTSDEMKPVAVIAASSYDELIADIDHLGELGGQPSAGQQIEGMLALFTQGQGLQGLDKSKEWGAVIQTDGVAFNPIVCLPVSDLESLLALVEGFGMTTSDVGDGITEIESPNQSIYVKEEGGWAFVSQEPEALNETPADPAELFKSLTDEYDIGARVMLQNVPDMYRQIAISQMQAGAEQGLERMPNESDDAYEARRKGVEANIDQVVQLMEELDEITIGFNFDNAAGNAYLDFAYSALPGSQAATALGAYEAMKSNFAGCINEQAAVRFNITAETPPEVLAQQSEQIEVQMQSLRQQAMNAIDQEAELPNEEARETLKEAANDLLDALEATALSGQFDAAGHIDIDAGTFSVIVGGFAKETGKIESAAKKIVALVENEPGFAGVNWNADSHQGASIHTMSIPVPEDEEDAQKIFGESLDLALALGNDVVYFAAGQDCMSNLKQAMDGSGSSNAVGVKPMQMTISLMPILDLIAANDPSGNPVTPAMADAVANAGAGFDEVHMTMESIDDQLRVRIELEKGVIEAIGAAAGAARGAGAGAGF